jgi:hypothetical protein
MAIVMNLKWKGMTPEMYDKAKEIVDWEGRPAPGAMYHCASFEADYAYVTDVWESAEDFERFVETRLMPCFTSLGVTTQPEVTIRPAHGIWAPGYSKTSTIDLAGKKTKV